MYLKRIVPIIITSVLLCLSAASCSSSRKAVESQSVNTTVSGDPVSEFKTLVATYSPQWQRLRMPVSASIAKPMSLGASGYLTMARGESIALSMRVFGMEVAALYVNNDQILVIDRWNKRYLLESIGVFLNGFNVSVENLQDLLLGRLFMIGHRELTPSDSSLFDFEKHENLWGCTPKGASELFSYAFILIGESLQSLNVEVLLKGGQVKYAEPQATDYGVMASGLSFETVSGSKEISVSLSYKPGKAQWNADVSIPEMNVPKGYTRIDSGSLLKGMINK